MHKISQWVQKEKAKIYFFLFLQSQTQSSAEREKESKQGTFTPSSTSLEDTRKSLGINFQPYIQKYKHTHAHKQTTYFYRCTCTYIEFKYIHATQQTFLWNEEVSMRSITGQVILNSTAHSKTSTHFSNRKEKKSILNIRVCMYK